MFTRPPFLFFQHNQQYDTLLPIPPCTHKLKAGIAYWRIAFITLPFVCSHVIPLYSSVQWQIKLSPLFSHLALFKHGKIEQSPRAKNIRIKSFYI
jgi:hypothetical protein